jgi:hypothetical protein
MAEQKTESAQATTSEPAKVEGKKKIKKTEAVRRSLKKLGADAKPTEIQKDIKKRFGIDMTTDHISTTKGQLRKEAAKNAPAAKQGGAKPAAVQAVPSARAASNGNGSAVDLKDILKLKDLVRRVGADHLHTLIDVMNR